MHQPQFLTRETNAFVLAGLVGTGIGLLAPIAVEQATSGKNLWLALAPLVLPVLLLMAMRPVLGAAAVIGFGFVNPSLLPPLIELGELSLRYVDAVFGLFICIVLAGMAIQRRIGISVEFRELFTPLLLFLFYIGISLITVRIVAPNSFAASVASYLRLMLTIAFAPILHLALRDCFDLYFYHKALKFLAVATISSGIYLVWAGLEDGGTDLFSGRSGGVIGTGSLGLVSGLLVLYAVIKRDENRRSIEWIISLALGLLGLYLAKTAVSVFAAAVTSTVYMSMRPHRSGFMRSAVVGTIMMMAAGSAILSLRPNDVSGFVNLSGGSFTERLMIAYAGVQIFLDNPLVGVGWQASTADTVLGSPALITAVSERFSQLPNRSFVLAPPTSLHNMYIQFLAELGIIGFALFVWVCIRTGRRVARVCKNIPTTSPYRVWLQFNALSLLFLLIWWNHNPLFGGQIESILAMSLIAVLGTVPELEKQRIQSNHS
jgi:hypothetical protein